MAERVQEFLPWYSSVHRGAGYKSRLATEAYEEARAAALCFAGRAPDGDDVAIICRNTTEAINHLAYRLRLQPDDVVVTTVVEHHANLLPWARLCRRRFVECGPDGTFAVDDVVAALDDGTDPVAAGGHRRVERDGLARRRSTPSSPPPTSVRSPCSSTPPSSPPTGRCPPPPTTWRGAATRCTPRSAPGC